MGGVTTKLTTMAPKRPFTHAEAVAARKLANEARAAKESELERERLVQREREADEWFEKLVDMFNGYFGKHDTENMFTFEMDEVDERVQSIVVERLREAYPYCDNRLWGTHKYSVAWEDI